jgi:hypothetical protein
VVPFADVPARTGLVSRSGDRPAWPVPPPDENIAADTAGVGGFLLRTNRNRSRAAGTSAAGRPG